MLTFSDLSMDLATRDVRRGDRPIELTRTEFTLLEMFLRRPRRVLERSFILEEVWGYDFPTTANSLEVYVGYLRRKTEAEGEPRLIHTVRGVGYVLKEHVTGLLPLDRRRVAGTTGGRWPAGSPCSPPWRWGWRSRSSRSAPTSPCGCSCSRPLDDSLVERARAPRPPIGDRLDDLRRPD